MKLEKDLLQAVKSLLESHYNAPLTAEMIQFQKTRPDFEGDVTLVAFPLVKLARKSPVQTAEEIGQLLVENIDFIEGFNAVQGFLNLQIKSNYWLQELNEILTVPNYGTAAPNQGRIMVEYSSPNTNKPLHLGHLRNNFLGHSVARILEANGRQVVKTQIINDRGIHICKSMLAWQRYGDDETPTSSGLKGDKLVGKYYVAFDKVLKLETAKILTEWQQGNFNKGERFEEEYFKLRKAADEKEDEKAKKAIEDNGGKVGSSISSKTDYVIAGENMGPSKLEKAKQLNIPIITENDFKQLVNG
jgi:arginyl-tRNA synthetase